MNWQKLSNVNPPIGQLLLMYDPELKQFFFAKRGPFSISIAQAAIDITDYGWGAVTYPYVDFKEDAGAGCYWCILQAPNE